MGRPVKLTPAERAEIANTVMRRHALTRMIARLTDERRMLPGVTALAKRHNVGLQTIRRAVMARLDGVF